MSHSLRYAVNCSILFTDLPILERAAAAKAAGFDAVEFWWPFADAAPADKDVDAFVVAVQNAGVEMVGLNFFAGDMPSGDRGVVSWPARSAEFRENIPFTLDIGERLGCRAYNALYGNRVEGFSAAEQDELGAENLALAATAARAVGGTVLVEPISGAAAFPLLTAADALAVIDRASLDNIGLLADFYHLAVNGDNVDHVIDAHYDRIAHVQIADSPERTQPGTGELPLMAQLARLESHGYAGWVGLEYKSSGSSDDFGWMTRQGELA